MNFWETLILPYQAYKTHWVILEISGTLFGILSVYFSIKKQILVFPTGIISTLIYVYLLFIFGLLGDMLINFYYTVMSIYGWWLWSQSKLENNSILPEKATRQDVKKSVILFVSSFVLVSMVYYFKPFLDYNLDYEGASLVTTQFNWANAVDIFLTSVFLVGMWLMAKKRIENWWFWIVGDFISIPMYINKEMYITCFQYVVFTIMAIVGYYQWRKSYLKNLNLN